MTLLKKLLGTRSSSGEVAPVVRIEPTLEPMNISERAIALVATPPEQKARFNLDFNVRKPTLAPHVIPADFCNTQAGIALDSSNQMCMDYAQETYSGTAGFIGYGILSEMATPIKPGGGR